MCKSILVVEHEFRRRLMLERHLTKQGFGVQLADNSDEGLSLAFDSSPHLILLDLMMPNWTGYLFLQRYRRRRNTPIITMTAKKEESEAVMAFKLGADDVVTKPLRMRELVARIDTVLRRLKQATDRYEVGDVVLDRISGTVMVRQRAINLTYTESHLLAILMSQAGHVVPRQTLFKGLIEKGYTGSERSIKGHVCNLRKKLVPKHKSAKSHASYPTYIKTVFGVGYRFSADERHGFVSLN